MHKPLNSVQNLLDIQTEYSNIHLFIASWYHLVTIFSWWC